MRHLPRPMSQISTRSYVPGFVQQRLSRPSYRTVQYNNNNNTIYRFRGILFGPLERDSHSMNGHPRKAIPFHLKIPTNLPSYLPRLLIDRKVKNNIYTARDRSKPSNLETFQTINNPRNWPIAMSPNACVARNQPTTSSFDWNQ